MPESSALGCSPPQIVSQVATSKSFNKWNTPLCQRLSMLHLPLRVGSTLPAEEWVTATQTQSIACLLRPFLVPTMPIGWSGHQMLRQIFYWRVIPTKGKSKKEVISLPWSTKNVSASLVGSSGEKIYVGGKLIGGSPVLSFNQSLTESQRKIIDLRSKAKADTEEAKSWRLSANHIPHSWTVGLFLKRDLQTTSLCLPELSKISASVLWFLNPFLIVTINPGIGSFKCCPCWRCLHFSKGKVGHTWQVSGSVKPRERASRGNELMCTD